VWWVGVGGGAVEEALLASDLGASDWSRRRRPHIRVGEGWGGGDTSNQEDNDEG
jgi:hypothetical protein